MAMSKMQTAQKSDRGSRVATSRIYLRMRDQSSGKMLINSKLIE